MRDYLKRYTVRLKTLVPLFIGSGEKLGKKEYVYNERKKEAWIFDTKKLFHFLAKEGLAGQYESYLVEGRQDLYSWMRDNHIEPARYKAWADYRLDCNYAEISRNERDIWLFVKDPYGNPYIPGSSLKGALRTALLGYEASKNSCLTELKSEIQEKSRARSRGELSRNMGSSEKKLETKILHTVDRGDNVEKKNAVCDALAGLRVGDSTPADKKKLILCQKIDRNIDRTKPDRAMPLFRECVQPGTEFQFELTVDETLCRYTGQSMLEAVDYFSRNAGMQYEKYGLQKPQKSHVLAIGGGAGYLSKTLVYNLYQDEEAVRVAADIMCASTPRNHGHNSDVKRGVSPHTLKITRYGGRTYLFGQCEIDIFPREA